MSEAIRELEAKEYQSTLLELEILSTKNQIQNEEDETHIIFWNDYLRDLNYELDGINRKIYLLRQKIKKSVNEKKFQLN